MASPAVSLIIPCYQSAEELVARALDSCAAQRFSDFEILLVDDGSEALFRDALRRQAARFSNCRVIEAEHGGVSAARNRGIRAANGAYLAFLDADDALTENFLLEAHSLAQETGADFVIGGVCLTNEIVSFASASPEGDLSFRFYEQGDSASLQEQFLCRSVRIDFPGGTISKGPVARLIRRELCLRHPFDESLRIGEDEVWNLSVLSEAPSVCIAHRQWYWYWQNPASAMHRFQPDIAEVWEKHLSAVRGVTDISSEPLRQAYIMHVYDGVFFIWQCFLKWKQPAFRAQQRAVRRALYAQAPWTLLADRGFFRRASRKFKFISLLYRTRVLFPVLSLWQRAKSTQTVKGERQHG